MSTFSNGMEVGQRAAMFGLTRADQNRQQETENRRQAERDAQDRLDRELDRKRRDQLYAQFSVEVQAKRDEMARFVESSAAFDRFNAAASMLDPGNPASLDQYATVTKQYLPAILKHEGITKKWEAADRVFKQGQAFTIKKVSDAAVLQSMEEAARIAPEVMINPPKNPDGTPDFATIRNIIADRRREIEEHQVNLRRAAVDARADAEAAGAYGGRTANKPQKREIGPAAKAEIAFIADELKTVNDRIIALRGVALPDKPKAEGERHDTMLKLETRKASLLRQLRAFDRAENPEPPVPNPAPVSAPQATQAPPPPRSVPPVIGMNGLPAQGLKAGDSFRIGEFKGRVLEVED